jgi:hypothetical protein
MEGDGRCGQISQKRSQTISFEISQKRSQKIRSA